MTPTTQTTEGIRTATLADLDTLAVLFDAYRQFYEQPADLPLARHFIAERLRHGQSILLLAEDTLGHALGFCQMYPSFCSVEALPIGLLYDLFVAPPGRRRGVGRRLLLAAEDAARAQGFVRMDLTTAKPNLPAQALYESLGWVRDEIFHAYNRRVAGATG